ncbi:MarR family transcriptional regulator [Nocardia gipuzkoensis]|uniref:MarR family transcriptional regulator n=1 Tax=Nocardia gipuzkoensis TaxID=2749991 RepID=UPI001E5E6E47|nr:MarR family transcriptional regulator [Nocardia gipuzkoensis]UGT68270.1 MarR family transcriptional regulator [Nocardia gipuzkoensis]
MAVPSTREETLGAVREELRRQATQTVVFHSAVAARLGITVTDLSALNLLSMQGPLTPGQLADQLGVTRGGAITTVVDRLERAGYVRRSRDSEDRRRVRVELVAVRAEVAVAPLYGELAALDEGMPDDDATLRTLLDFVRKVNAALVRATSRVSEAHTV